MRAKNRLLLTICLLPWAVAAQMPGGPPDTLPAPATTALATSLKAAAAHERNVWRDTAPMNSDGTVNAYIEIGRGDRQKWEFNIGANARAIDRVMPESVGGYAVNYGFVPQTISYDGDPFDALVLGPPLAGGRMVAGIIVGVMFMEDEKGHDSKVVLSLAGRDGRPIHALTAGDQRTIGDYFKRYKRQEPGKFSKVPGWGSVSQGVAYVTATHAFYEKCRDRAGQPCRVGVPKSSAPLATPPF